MSIMVNTEGDVLLGLIEVLVNLKKEIGTNLLQMGKILYKIKEERLYAPQYESFNEFLAMPELSFSRAMAYKAVVVYRVFVETYAAQDLIEGIDPDKLYKIAGVVDNNNLDDWLGKARVLSRGDLTEEVREAKGNKPRPGLLELVEEFLEKHKHLILPREIIYAWESWRKQKKLEVNQ